MKTLNQNSHYEWYMIADAVSHLSTALSSIHFSSFCSEEHVQFNVERANKYLDFAISSLRCAGFVPSDLERVSDSKSDFDYDDLSEFVGSVESENLR